MALSFALLVVDDRVARRCAAAELQLLLVDVQ